MPLFVMFVSLTPRAVKAISSTKLVEINKHLQQEIDARRQAETEKLTAQIRYSNVLSLACGGPSKSAAGGGAF